MRDDSDLTKERITYTENNRNLGCSGLLSIFSYPYKVIRRLINNEPEDPLDAFRKREARGYLEDTSEDEL